MVWRVRIINRILPFSVERMGSIPPIGRDICWFGHVVFSRRPKHKINIITSEWKGGRVSITKNVLMEFDALWINKVGEVNEWRGEWMTYTTSSLLVFSNIWSQETDDGWKVTEKKTKKMSDGL